MKKIDAKTKMMKARSSMILEHPFFATILLSMEYMEDSSADTMWIDGQTIGYNFDFIDSLSMQKLKGGLAHEALHVGDSHHLRRNNRDSELWNEAADLAINPILLESGFELPDGALVEPSMKGEAAETIYNRLNQKPKSQNKEQQQEQQQKSSGSGKGKGKEEKKGDSNNKSKDPGRCGEVRDAKQMSEADKQKAEADTRILVAQASAVAKRAGKIPGGLQRMIDNILNPKIPWKEALSRFLSQTTIGDYSWKEPNKRYLPCNIYLPSVVEEETLGFITIIIDTSGSISKQIMNQFAAEIQEIINCYESDAELLCLFVDARLQHVQYLDRQEVPPKLNPKGGGGTSFRPGFDYLDKERIDSEAIIYLTDGYCSSFPVKEPDSPVMWVISPGGSSYFNPPFGETIYMYG